MIRKLPPEAYACYLGLGPERSYRAVAAHFGVSTRAVSKRASAEGWQDRIRSAEKEAFEAIVAQTEAAAIDRSLRWIRKLEQEHQRAMEALTELKIETVEDALKVLDWSLTEERRIVRLLARHRRKPAQQEPAPSERSEQ